MTSLYGGDDLSKEKEFCVDNLLVRILVDMLGLRYKFVDFGSEWGPTWAFWGGSFRRRSSDLSVDFWNTGIPRSEVTPTHLGSP